MYHLTAHSRNEKTGFMPVSTSSMNTCPEACPLKKKGCYAKSGPLALHWLKVTNGERGLTFDDFCGAIKKLACGALWRHNQAGDLAGKNDIIDAPKLKQLVQANKGRRGYTYSHYPMDCDNNIDAVKHANKNGFTINLSANSLSHADELKALDIAPIVAILPMDAKKVNYTPEGNKIVTCPAQTCEKTTCANCQLCQLTDRTYIIGFLAHGSAKKHVNELSLIA